jgi:hypothetical protein
MKVYQPLLVASLLACHISTGAQILNAAGQPPRVGQLATQNQLPVTAPYGLVNGTIVLQASIKDNIPLNAVMATSLSICMIKPEIAQSQGVESGDLTKFTSLFGLRTISGAKPQIVHVGKATVNAVPMGMFDPLEALSGRKEANLSMPSLWLGNSFLGVFTVFIDPEKQEVSLKSITSTMPSKATIVPFEIDNGRLIILVKAAGVSFKAIVDTTSMGTFLPERAAREAKIVPDATMNVTGPEGKKGVVGIGTVSELTVGDISIPLPRVLFAKEGNAGGMDPDLGILGNDFLLRHKVTISYSQGRIAFEKISGNAVTGAGTTKPTKPDPKTKPAEKPKKGKDAPPAINPQTVTPPTTDPTTNPTRAADPAAPPITTDAEKKAGDKEPTKKPEKKKPEAKKPEEKKDAEKKPDAKPADKKKPDDPDHPPGFPD